MDENETLAADGTMAGSQGKADVAKEQAAHLADESADAGHEVMGVAKDQASKVASEAKTQAKDLMREAQTQLNEQAAAQQQRVAQGLRSVSDELHSMADNSENRGMATDLVQQAASKAGNVASWLDERDPGSLLEEIRSFARRRPGAFIGIAAVAGVLAGRLTRSIASEASESNSDTAQYPSVTPVQRETAVPTTVTPPVTAPVTTPVYDASIGREQL